MMMMAKHGMQIQKHIGLIQMHCKEMSTKNNLPGVHFNSDGVLVTSISSTDLSPTIPPATTMYVVPWCWRSAEACLDLPVCNVGPSVHWIWAPLRFPRNVFVEEYPEENKPPMTMA